jgi:hypothetical protein
MLHIGVIFGNNKRNMLRILKYTQSHSLLITKAIMTLIPQKQRRSNSKFFISLNTWIWNKFVFQKLNTNVWSILTYSFFKACDALVVSML